MTFTQEEIEFIEANRPHEDLGKLNTQRLDEIQARETGRAPQNNCWCNSKARQRMKNDFYTWFNSR